MVSVIFAKVIFRHTHLPHLAYKGMWNFTELLRATLRFLDLVPLSLQNDQPAERKGAIVLAKEEGARIVRGED